MTKLSTQETLSDVSNSYKQIKQKQVGKAKTPEETLSVIAKAVLWIGIATCVIFIIGGIDNLTDFNETMGIIYIALGLFILVASIVTWAALKVLFNISNNLRQINQKTK